MKLAHNRDTQWVSFLDRLKLHSISIEILTIATRPCAWAIKKKLRDGVTIYASPNS